jgi:mono/diheme cytochrome c family protein
LKRSVLKLFDHKVVRTKPLSALFVLALAGLLLSACTLAGDITPPPDYRPTEPVEPTAARVVFPLVAPDPARGESIYVEKCAPCHGDTGLGDGSQAGELPVVVPALGNPEVARAATPMDWFQMVTNGNMQQFMPPFASLSDRQRWDVVAYAYSLHVSAGDVEQGQQVYAQACQECHGETGGGDGDRAAQLSADVPDWHSPDRLVEFSDEQLFQSISQGVGESMPAFGGTLEESQLWASVAYVRSLGFAGAASEDQQASSVGEQEQAAAGDEPAGEPETADSEVEAAAEGEEVAADASAIVVTVNNGTGGEVPADLPVTLEVFANMQPATTMEGTLRADGTVVFEGLEPSADLAFVAWTDYKETRFFSGILQGENLALGDQTELPLPIYEASTDRSALFAQRAHVFFEFPETGKLRVIEMFLILNASERVVVAEEPGGSVIEYKLPEGATNLQFENTVLGERFIATADGFADTTSILPGMTPTQVIFAYELPYDRKSSIDIEMPVPVSSIIVALTDVEGVRLESPQLMEAGTQPVEGMSIQMYSGSSMAAGETLQIDLSGRPGSGPQLVSGSTTTLVLGLGIFLAAAVGVGFYVRSSVGGRRREEEDEDLAPEDGLETEDSVDSLLDAIVALDDLYKAGELPRDAYLDRRAELKERLRALKE